jgi:hypothetical protein
MLKWGENLGIDGIETTLRLLAASLARHSPIARMLE